MLLLKRSLKKHHGKATLQEKNSLKMDLKAFIHLSSGQHVHYSHFGFRPGSFGLEPNLGGNERERIGINRCRESLENTNQPSTGLLPLLPFLFCVSGQSHSCAGTLVHQSWCVDNQMFHLCDHYKCVSQHWSTLVKNRSVNYKRLFRATNVVRHPVHHLFKTQTLRFHQRCKKIKNSADKLIIKCKLT